MTWAAYAFMIVFVSTLAELLLDSLGVSLPLVAMACFYIFVAYGLWSGLACALLGGGSLDFLLGREHPFSVLLLLLVMGLAALWLYRLEASSPLLLCVPGALLPFIVWVPWAAPAWSMSMAWLSAFFDCLSGAFLAAICSAILLPLAVMGLDFLGQRLELELFSDAKDRVAGAQ